MFRDRTADLSLIALKNAFSAPDVRRTITDCGIFSAPISCVSLF